MIYKNQRGDTIVEVLVALSIIGAVLAGVFTAASRSQTINQQSQERSSAVRVAESQLELIKAQSNIVEQTTEDMYSIDPDDGFCLRYQAEEIELFEYTIGDVENDPLTVGPYINDCVIENRYYVYNQRFEVDGKQRFRTIVQWERLGGGRDQVIMTYGLQQAEISQSVNSTIAAKLKSINNVNLIVDTDLQTAEPRFALSRVDYDRRV